MKSVLFLVAGITGTVAYMLVRQRAVAGQPAPGSDVGELAHRLQHAWADHHTTA